MLTPASPTTSPSLTAQEVPSRKRQRSQSMQSEASSSSPKRSASLDPTSQDSFHTQQTQTMSTLSISDKDKDIDAYMADQEEAAQSSQSTFPDPPPPPITLNGSPPTSHLSLPEKLDKITTLCRVQMTPGETWYLVGRRWFKRFQKACSGEVDKEGAVSEKDLGPVDNSTLVDSRGNLISPIVEHVDVEYVPEEAWNLLVSWYGTPQYVLPRKVVTRGIAEEITLELQPPTITAFLLSNSSSNTNTAPLKLTVSSKDTVEAVRSAISDAVLGIKDGDVTDQRIWKLGLTSSCTTLQYPASNLKEDEATLLESSNTTFEDALLGDGDQFVIEVQVDGEWLSDREKGSESSPAIHPRRTFKHFGGPDFFTQLQSKTSPVVERTTRSTSSKPSSVTSSGLTRVNRPAVEPGTLGLGNMGNTCFMNSAIQCLAHTKELTDYFLTDVYQDELNLDNPLGMHGEIARAFGSLLHKIWDANSSSQSYSPREFKQVLQRFAPQFGGYQQHDSQELVAFLLDGLHEDLNRIIKKPYVEKPDWEGGGDRELALLAKNSWDGYMQRNDSVVVDLFQGQYQSTLVCPECQKVSITFDPFMYLTLPLPVLKKYSNHVYYVPWDVSKPHVKIPVELDRDASFRDVRQLLARWMGTSADHLVTLEIYNNRFYKNLDDHTAWGDMGENDTLVCFELPCNSNQSRPKKRQEGDPFIVPVFLCDMVQRPRPTFSNSSYGLFGYPFLIALSEEQASDVDKMYDAVVERLERWTPNVRDLYQWEFDDSSPSSSMEEVSIPITSSSTPADSVCEIIADGDVVTVEEVLPEEGDIADQGQLVRDANEDESMTPSEPRKVGTKKGIFQLHVQTAHSPFGVGYSPVGTHFDKWEQRKTLAESKKNPVLLRENDALFCDFDENMKSYYFGVDSNRTTHPNWDLWEDFVHPEYTASREALAAKKKKTITLQDCLDEFTKEEKLGEDDLWYCPQCKKHQQATKRFDLWKVPDILVVHLKRFSSNRTLRDKIDSFVDFPLTGLDLTDMVGERQIAQRLSTAGVDKQGLALHDIDEPLLYDLYAVDEHLGGLGGGHYRAYAYNHVTDKWYHFDDSYVTQSQPEAAVNANAYLLFYRRRTSRPIGGKSHDKIEEARSIPREPSPTPEEQSKDDQLPTPPSETPKDEDNSVPVTFWPSEQPSWGESPSVALSSPVSSSPPPLDEADPPSFEDSQLDDLIDPTLSSLHNNFAFPDPSRSPTSSNEAEAESDLEDRDDFPLSSVDQGSGQRMKGARSVTNYTDYDNSDDEQDTNLPPTATASESDSITDSVEEIPITYHHGV
ncbi:hypothetical protein C8Q75DRAFT_767864 [Abortiporus biennis]|nr:hypothetical protein C8Q75DRAFT_767864 [Abortiporus biennis]